MLEASLTHTVVCEEGTPEKKMRGRMSFQSKSWGGGQCLLLKCRAKAHTKGVFVLLADTCFSKEMLDPPVESKTLRRTTFSPWVASVPSPRPVPRYRPLHLLPAARREPRRRERATPRPRRGRRARDAAPPPRDAAALRSACTATCELGSQNRARTVQVRPHRY